MAQTAKERAAWLIGYNEGERRVQGQTRQHTPKEKAYGEGLMAFFDIQHVREIDQQIEDAREGDDARS